RQTTILHMAMTGGRGKPPGLTARRLFPSLRGLYKQEVSINKTNARISIGLALWTAVGGRVRPEIGATNPPIPPRCADPRARPGVSVLPGRARLFPLTTTPSPSEPLAGEPWRSVFGLCLFFTRRIFNILGLFNKPVRSSKQLCSVADTTQHPDLIQVVEGF